MKELTDLVEKLVTEKTFNLEAAKAVEDLKEKFRTKDQEHEALRAALKGKSEELIERAKIIADLEAKVKGLEHGLKLLQEQDAKAKTAIYEAERERAVAAAYKDALHTIFRPNAVRETIHRSTPISVQASPQCSGYVQNYNSTEEVTKEG